MGYNIFFEIKMLTRNLSRGIRQAHLYKSAFNF